MTARLVARSIATCPCATLTITQGSQAAYCGTSYCPPPPPPPPPPGICSSFPSNAGWSCHTAWTGDPANAIKTRVGLSCHSTSACLAAAVAGCSAEAGCEIFAMQTPLPAKGGVVGGAVVSYFKLPKPSSGSDSGLGSVTSSTSAASAPASASTSPQHSPSATAVSPPPTTKKRGDQLLAVACEYGDPSQAFTFTGSADGKTAGSLTIA